MVVAEGQARVISNFALTHFEAAKHFADKVKEVEDANVGQPFGNFWQEISIYSASCIILATASLEALINELFIAPGLLRDSVPDFEKFYWGSEETPKGFEWKPALKKYKKALSILKKPPLSKLEPTYQQAESLITFRNYLIHFQPLWDDKQSKEGLEDQLEGRFKISPYVDDGADFLAKKCMSAGCAEWAVRTVSEFVQDYAHRSELDPKKMDAFQL